MSMNGAEKLGQEDFYEALRDKVVDFSKKPVVVGVVEDTVKLSVSKEVADRYELFVEGGRGLGAQERTARLAGLKDTDAELFDFIQARIGLSKTKYVSEGRRSAAREFAIRKGLQIVDEAGGQVREMHVKKIAEQVSKLTEQQLKIASGQ